MNGQDPVMGWIWGQIKEGASQGGFPGSGFDNGWSEAPFTEVRLQKGKMGWGYGGAVNPVRSLQEIQVLGRQVWNIGKKSS